MGEVREGGGTEEISREVREGVNKFGKSTINAAILREIFQESYMSELEGEGM